MIFIHPMLPFVYGGVLFYPDSYKLNHCLLYVNTRLRSNCSSFHPGPQLKSETTDDLVWPVHNKKWVPGTLTQVGVPGHTMAYLSPHPVTLLTVIWGRYLPILPESLVYTCYWQMHIYMSKIFKIYFSFQSVARELGLKHKLQPFL